MNSSNELRVDEVEAGIWVLTLNRPERRNALTGNLLSSILGVAERLELERSIPVGLIMTGAGTAFSAGMDFNELTGSGEDEWVDSALAAVHEAFQRTSFPIVAAVEGQCIGAGLDLALGCDLIVAGADARFSLPAARLGLLYRTPVAARLVARCGQETAIRLLALGERLSAKESLAKGLVAEVAAAGRATQRAQELMREFEVAPRSAVSATMHLIRSLHPGQDDLEGWRRLRHVLDTSTDRSEAFAAAARNLAARRGSEMDS